MRYFQHATNTHHYVLRLTTTCQKKCVSPKFNEGELNKGEATCLDRCVSKYIEIQKQIDTKFGIEMQAGQKRMQSIQEQLPQT